MARTHSHLIETKSKDCVRSRINNFKDNGDCLFRELSERDYGIDALIECFDDGIPTGKIGFLQIKGTDAIISPLKRTPVIACGKYIGVKFTLRRTKPNSRNCDLCFTEEGTTYVLY